MSGRELPAYRIVHVPGGCKISTPLSRKIPLLASRMRVWPTVWDALNWLHDRNVSWRDIGWMTTGRQEND